MAEDMNIEIRMGLAVLEWARVKRAVTRLALAAFVVTGVSGALCAENAGPVTGESVRATQERPAQGGVFTFYVWDPLARSLCFSDGRAGLMILKNRIENRCSDLNFNLARGGSFTTGIEADRVGAIIDLGTADDLRERYRYDDAAGGGEGFASLQMQGQNVVILKEDNPDEVLQPLKEAAALSEVGPSANAPVRRGHIYLLRLAGKKDSSFQVIVKLIVIAYAPDESVTVRWERL
jgi:hypothetical protein